MEYSFTDKEKIINDIKKLDLNSKKEILRIIHKYDNDVKITENIYGSILDFNKLNYDTIKKIEEFINYLNDKSLSFN